jgi:hypothetical protein
MSQEIKNRNLFKGKEIYFSNSIQGVVNQEQDFAWRIVQFLQENGASVLDRHVAARGKEEAFKLYVIDTGHHLDGEDKPWILVESDDVGLVDKCSYLIAFVDGPSHGVGAEVQRAIDLWEFVGKRIEVLCMVQEQNLDKLSFMIRGKEKPKYSNFHLKTYKDLVDAKSVIKNFLMNN